MPNQFAMKSTNAKSDPISSGRPLPPKTKQTMESAFRSDFSDVRIHNDGASAKKNAELHSLAFTRGTDIFFMPERYQPETRGGVELLAHELAHVEQQRNGPEIATQTKSDSITPENDPAEQRADAAAKAVLRGEPVPYLGSLAKGQISRVVNTKYGAFDTTRYVTTTTRGMDAEIGCEIELQFTPNSNAPHTDRIGLIQTVHNMDRGTPVSMEIAPEFALTANDPSRRGTGQAKVGMHIDRAKRGMGGLGQPNTNPVYGSENTEDHYAQNLADNPPTEENQLGYRKWKGANVPAKLFDGPSLWKGPRKSQIFETAAMLVSGGKRGKYLGSVSWGWRSNDRSVPVLEPLTKVSDGDPSGDFLDAADKWNAVGANDGKAVVPIPTRAHGKKAPWR